MYLPAPGQFLPPGDGKASGPVSGLFSEQNYFIWHSDCCVTDPVPPSRVRPRAWHPGERGTAPAMRLPAAPPFSSRKRMLRQQRVTGNWQRFSHPRKAAALLPQPKAESFLSSQFKLHCPLKHIFRLLTPLRLLILLITASFALPAGAQTPDWHWARQARGADPGTGRDVATDPDGNVFVTGDFEGSLTFGTTILTSPGSADMFLTKYDSTGRVRWA